MSEYAANAARVTLSEQVKALLEVVVGIRGAIGRLECKVLGPQLETPPVTKPGAPSGLMDLVCEIADAIGPLQSRIDKIADGL